MEPVMTTAMLNTDPRLGAGSSVTPTDHRKGFYQGVIVSVNDPWSRVLWSVPVHEETLEWLPTLQSSPVSARA
jgi:hypothetical protein